LFAQSAVERPDAVYKMLQAFGLLQAPSLPHFGTESGEPLQPLQATDPTLLLKQGAGQGALTITPLQMALVAATVANHGKAITPFLAGALRLPETTEWQPLNESLPQHAVMTQEVADMVGVMMKDAVEHGAAQPAQQSGLDVHGHASIAFTGPQDKQAAWFIGYVVLSDGKTIAIATVIENADAALAAQVSGQALAEASTVK
jgi:penicillin-binding protein A